MASLFQPLSSFFKISKYIKPEILELQAVPGLTTVLDVALYRSFEAQLTATVTSGHNLIHCWLDMQRQAVQVLHALQGSTETLASRQLEALARQCLDAACDAVDRLATDRMASTANLVEGGGSETLSGSGVTMGGGGGGGHHGSGSGTFLQSSSSSSVLSGSSNETGRRRWQQQQQQLRGKDCWESPRLYCPDYLWADDAAQLCQRLLRQLLKNPFVVDRLEQVNSSNLLATAWDESQNTLPSKQAEQEAKLLFLIITADLPARLVQFRQSIEADSVVSKRLYLVKMEYRAPLRCFWEAHQSLQRAPSLELVNEYMQLPQTKVQARQHACKERLSKLLGNSALQESLALEQKMDEFEGDMAKALSSFAELARYLDNKRARMQTPVADLVALRETLRRLKSILCRKVSAGDTSSTGIRPLLLDLQGVPRDEEKHASKQQKSYFTAITDDVARLNKFLQQLQTLTTMVQERHSFRGEKRADLEIPSSIVRGCSELDTELWSCQFQDWLTMVRRQQELMEQNDFERLAERIRRAEMQMSLALATQQSLEVVRQRLVVFASDRDKRWQVLQEMVQELCWREMNLRVRVKAPVKEEILELKPSSHPGIFGIALEVAEEPLPLG